jgi:hypothetical protein
MNKPVTPRHMGSILGFLEVFPHISPIRFRKLSGCIPERSVRSPGRWCGSAVADRQFRNTFRFRCSGLERAGVSRTDFTLRRPNTDLFCAGSVSGYRRELGSPLGQSFIPRRKDRRIPDPDVLRSRVEASLLGETGARRRYPRSEWKRDNHSHQGRLRIELGRVW